MPDECQVKMLEKSGNSKEKAPLHEEHVYCIYVIVELLVCVLRTWSYLVTAASGVLRFWIISPYRFLAYSSG